MTKFVQPILTITPIAILYKKLRIPIDNKKSYQYVKNKIPIINY